ncbi:flotillin family protein [Natranaerobius trueperi]|uniref:Flotillin n=1 Tax=Natranaerobius trueperi TaxID=759412 RepID=A0A226BVT1_9FIRM|nr:SPFH domain-containing protein [Natranaerobius trueperi]OWZ82882.1 flotillin [Natranaerobius trueperi]
MLFIISSILFTVQTLIILFILFVLGVIGLFILKKRYRTATSNEALVITGPNLGNPDNDKRIFVDEEGRSMKIIRGGGVRLKLFQTSTPINLNAFQIELTTPRVYTQEGVPVIADAIATIKIADSLQGIANYAEQFLGKDQNEIEEEVSRVLGTNLRAILAKLRVEEINNNRESFNNQVQEIAQNELNNMGFQITSFGLEDIRDEDPDNGYLINLGRSQIAEVQKQAEKAESEAEKETRIYKAQNEQEAEQEENKRKVEIAESQKEKDIKEAQIKEETERARAKSEQAYELEQARLQQEVKEEEMKVEHIERQKQVEFEEEEKKKRQAQADADAYEVEAKARAEAEEEKIKGETQANIIREKGKAEAEAKEEMAKAMEKYGEAAVIEMLIKMLPDYAKEVSKPLSQINEMKVVDMSGSESKGGASNVANNVTNTMLGIQEGLKESTGMDLKGMLENFTQKSEVASTSEETETEQKEE